MGVINDGHVDPETGRVVPAGTRREMTRAALAGWITAGIVAGLGLVGWLTWITCGLFLAGLMAVVALVGVVGLIYVWVYEEVLGGRF